jgi:peptide/nickel transport system substrate-binding protein
VKKRNLTLNVLIGIALLVMMLMPACTNSASPTTPSTAPNTTAAKTTTTGSTVPAASTPVATTAPPTAATTAAKAKPDGTFTFGTASLETEGYLPWNTFLSNFLLYSNVYDPLTGRTADGKTIPAVAESWEWNSNYTKLTLHIRKGIQFNDGWGALTARDVVYMFQQTMSAKSQSGAKSFMGEITSIDMPDDYTVVVNQKQPNIDNADSFAFTPIYASVPCAAYVQKVGWDEANRNPVGSGPYKISDRKTGDYVKFEAVDNHWRVVPEFKYLVIKAVPEESTRVAMLKTGAIDATLISEQSMKDLQQKNITVENWPYGPHSAIMFGGLERPGTFYYKAGYHNVDPWTNIKVREAMNIAIDRNAINKALHNNLGVPMAVIHQMPGFRDQTPIPFDPARAKQLLTEAGFPNGFSFTLVSAPSHPGIPMVAKEAEAVVGYWADVGIKANIQAIDFPAYNEKASINQNVGQCYTYRYIYGGANPYTMLMQLDLSDNHWGTRLQCEAADIMSPMAKAAMAEFDLTKRTDMYKKIAKVEHDNWVAIPLIMVPELMAKDNTKIGDWPPASDSYQWNFAYIRHAQPLNTFRLYNIKD